MSQHILLVYNPDSGVYPSASSVASYLKDLTGGANDLNVRMMPFNPRKKETIRSEIHVKPTHAVWVAAGDGTVTAVADCLLNSDVPIGVLPLGTMNLLARDLGMALNPSAAVDQLKKADPACIDTADINRHLMLNICNIGFSTNFTKMREKFRHVSPWIRWPLLLWYMHKALFVYPSFTIELRINNQKRIYRTRSVSITNNPLAADSMLLPSRKRINQGKLGIYIARNTSFWSLPVLIIKFLVGGWQFDEDLIYLTAAHATIIPRKRRRRRFKVMIDGELYKFKGPLRFRMRPGSLKILRPGPRP